MGLSLPRKRRFNVRNSWLLVTSTLTIPLSFIARLARDTNFANPVSLSPATCLRKIIKLGSALAAALSGFSAVKGSVPAVTQKQTGGPNPGTLLFHLTRSTRWLLLR